MTEPINLNKARKEREKAAAKAGAAENRAKHGRTAVQRKLDQVREEKSKRELDAKRRLHDDE